MTTAEEIVGAQATVADKIRALDRAGYPRAEIARLLGKRYQHVRNVLEGDKAAASSGVSEGDAAPFRADVHPTQWRGGGVFRMEMDAQGRLALPRQVIDAWGLKPGSVVMGRLEGESIELIAGATSARRARELARRLLPPGGPSMVDELIADRRAEVRRELDDE
ncbi:AbrB/MazE/SpoVT family DNA-binding domain-containing protein [Phenylobacterium sp.]|uniref:AbrB/MazE/SpoVT family DNA-binding domain-containing protein n=1 Tax=Phenylobacterium sp. TaxID=1871053 RepID=UPI0035B3E1B5